VTALVILDLSADFNFVDYNCCFHVLKSSCDSILVACSLVCTYFSGCVSQDPQMCMSFGCHTVTYLHSR